MLKVQPKLTFPDDAAALQYIDEKIVVALDTAGSDAKAQVAAVEGLHELAAFSVKVAKRLVNDERLFTAMAKQKPFGPKEISILADCAGYCDETGSTRTQTAYRPREAAVILHKDTPIHLLRTLVEGITDGNLLNYLFYLDRSFAKKAMAKPDALAKLIENAAANVPMLTKHILELLLDANAHATVINKIVALFPAAAIIGTLREALFRDSTMGGLYSKISNVDMMRIKSCVNSRPLQEALEKLIYQYDACALFKDEMAAYLETFLANPDVKEMQSLFSRPSCIAAGMDHPKVYQRLAELGLTLNNDELNRWIYQLILYPKQNTQVQDYLITKLDEKSCERLFLRPGDKARARIFFKSRHENAATLINRVADFKCDHYLLEFIDTDILDPVLKAIGTRLTFAKVTSHLRWLYLKPMKAEEKFSTEALARLSYLTDAKRDTDVSQATWDAINTPEVLTNLLNHLPDKVDGAHIPFLLGLLKRVLALNDAKLKALVFSFGDSRSDALRTVVQEHIPLADTIRYIMEIAKRERNRPVGAKVTFNEMLPALQKSIAAWKVADEKGAADLEARFVPKKDEQEIAGAILSIRYLYPKLTPEHKLFLLTKAGVRFEELKKDSFAPAIARIKGVMRHYRQIRHTKTAGDALLHMNIHLRANENTKGLHDRLRTPAHLPQQSAAAIAQEIKEAKLDVKRCTPRLPVTPREKKLFSVLVARDLVVQHASPQMHLIKADGQLASVQQLRRLGKDIPSSTPVTTGNDDTVFTAYRTVPRSVPPLWSRYPILEVNLTEWMAKNPGHGYEIWSSEAFFCYTCQMTMPPVYLGDTLYIAKYRKINGKYTKIHDYIYPDGTRHREEFPVGNEIYRGQNIMVNRGMRTIEQLRFLTPKDRQFFLEHADREDVQLPLEHALTRVRGFEIHKNVALKIKDEKGVDAKEVTELGPVGVDPAATQRIIDQLKKYGASGKAEDLPDWNPSAAEINWQGTGAERIGKFPATTPLCYAAAFLDTQALEWLLTHGADINWRVPHSNVCAIFCATVASKKENLEFLLNYHIKNKPAHRVIHPADPLPKSWVGPGESAALEIAVTLGSVEMIQALLDHHADEDEVVMDKVGSRLKDNPSQVWCVDRPALTHAVLRNMQDSKEDHTDVMNAIAKTDLPNLMGYLRKRSDLDFLLRTVSTKVASKMTQHTIWEALCRIKPEVMMGIMFNEFLPLLRDCGKAPPSDAAAQGMLVKLQRLFDQLLKVARETNRQADLWIAAYNIDDPELLKTIREFGKANPLSTSPSVAEMQVYRQFFSKLCAAEKWDLAEQFLDLFFNDKWGVNFGCDCVAAALKNPSLITKILAIAPDIQGANELIQEAAEQKNSEVAQCVVSHCINQKKHLYPKTFFAAYSLFLAVRPPLFDLANNLLKLWAEEICEDQAWELVESVDRPFLAAAVIKHLLANKKVDELGGKLHPSQFKVLFTGWHSLSTPEQQAALTLFNWAFHSEIFALAFETRNEDLWDKVFDEAKKRNVKPRLADPLCGQFFKATAVHPDLARKYIALFSMDEAAPLVTTAIASRDEKLLSLLASQGKAPLTVADANTSMKPLQQAVRTGFAKGVEFVVLTARNNGIPLAHLDYPAAINTALERGDKAALCYLIEQAGEDTKLLELPANRNLANELLNKGYGQALAKIPLTIIRRSSDAHPVSPLEGNYALDRAIQAGDTQSMIRFLAMERLYVGADLNHVSSKVYAALRSQFLYSKVHGTLREFVHGETDLVSWAKLQSPRFTNICERFCKFSEIISSIDATKSHLRNNCFFRSPSDKEQAFERLKERLKNELFSDKDITTIISDWDQDPFDPTKPSGLTCGDIIDTHRLILFGCCSCTATKSREFIDSLRVSPLADMRGNIVPQY